MLIKIFLLFTHTPANRVGISKLWQRLHPLLSWSPHLEVIRQMYFLYFMSVQLCTIYITNIHTFLQLNSHYHWHIILLLRHIDHINGSGSPSYGLAGSKLSSIGVLNDEFFLNGVSNVFTWDTPCVEKQMDRVIRLCHFKFSNRLMVTNKFFCYSMSLYSQMTSTTTCLSRKAPQSCPWESCLLVRHPIRALLNESLCITLTLSMFIIQFIIERTCVHTAAYMRKTTKRARFNYKSDYSIVDCLQ